MYKRLSEYRGQFIEVGQATPEGRRWYVGRLKSIDPDCLVLELFNSDGVYYSDLMMPLGSILSAYNHTTDSQSMQSIVSERQEQIEALKRCFNSKPDEDGGAMACR